MELGGHDGANSKKHTYLPLLAKQQALFAQIPIFLNLSIALIPISSLLSYPKGMLPLLFSEMSFIGFAALELANAGCKTVDLRGGDRGSDAALGDVEKENCVEQIRY